MPGESDPDLMGASLAIGDFDGDGFGDLAADSFAESVGGNDYRRRRDRAVRLGRRPHRRRRAGDHPGHARRPRHAAARRPVREPGRGKECGFDGDGRDELVAGMPNESVDGVFRAGAAYVMPGSERGPATAGGCCGPRTPPTFPTGRNKRDRSARPSPSGGTSDAARIGPRDHRPRGVDPRRSRSGRASGHVRGNGTRRQRSQPVRHGKGGRSRTGGRRRLIRVLARRGLTPRISRRMQEVLHLGERLLRERTPTGRSGRR